LGFLGSVTLPLSLTSFRVVKPRPCCLDLAVACQGSLKMSILLKALSEE